MSLSLLFKMLISIHIYLSFAVTFLLSVNFKHTDLSAIYLSYLCFNDIHHYSACLFYLGFFFKFYPSVSYISLYALPHFHYSS